MGSKVAIQTLNPYSGKYSITGEIKYENNWLAILENNGAQKGTETDMSVDLMIDIFGFATRRIYFWGQQCRNLAGSLSTPCPDQAYEPQNSIMPVFCIFS